MEDKDVIFYTSSAFHRSGNLLAETAVKRTKNAIGDMKIDDAWSNLVALNTTEPNDNHHLSPYELLYGLISPVNRIPIVPETNNG